MLVPLHAPLLMSRTASNAAPGVTDTVCDVSVATNENHVSNADEEVFPVQFKGASDCDANCRLPEVALVQEVSEFTGTAVALLHSSFAGGVGVLKLHVEQPLASPAAFFGITFHK
jgi:hypothetical protein